MSIDEARRLLIFARDLRQADLRGTSLVGIDFSTCDLTEGKLGLMNLSGADLSFANLTGASFFDSDLSHVDFTGANLSRADLDYAYLRGASFQGANLNRTALPDEPSVKDGIRTSVMTGCRVD